MEDNTSVAQRCYFLTFIPQDIDQVRHIYIMAAALDAILLLPTIILNIVLFISLYPQLHKPCTKLLYSLAISDVLVGMVIEPAYLTKKVAELHHCFDIYCYTGMVTYVGGLLTCVSFFNLTAIAVDRYLVVHSGTKYKTIVTNTRVTCLVITIWSLSGLLFSGQLYSPRDLYFKLTAFIMAACVTLASACYLKCFVTLRRHKREVNTMLKVNSTKQENTNVHRYKKSTYTMLYIFLLFNLCYLPYLCTAVSAGILGESAAIWGAESLSSVTIFANSLVNPIVLFWRMKEIRRAVNKTISIVHHSNGKQRSGTTSSNHQIHLQRLHLNQQSNP